MLGIIFNAVEYAVVDLYGDDAWDDLIEKSGVLGSYSALGIYPDQELIDIAHVACEATRMDLDELFVLIGRHSFPALIGHVEYIVNSCDDLFDFVESIHDLIHVEVRKLSPESMTPSIVVNRLSETSLEVDYESDRNMPALAQGLLMGAADYFGQDIEIVRGETIGNSTKFVLTLANVVAVQGS